MHHFNGSLRGMPHNAQTRHRIIPVAKEKDNYQSFCVLFAFPTSRHGAAVQIATAEGDASPTENRKSKCLYMEVDLKVPGGLQRLKGTRTHFI